MFLQLIFCVCSRLPRGAAGPGAVTPRGTWCCPHLGKWHGTGARHLLWWLFLRSSPSILTLCSFPGGGLSPPWVTLPLCALTWAEVGTGVGTGAAEAPGQARPARLRHRADGSYPGLLRDGEGFPYPFPG